MRLLCISEQLFQEKLNHSLGLLNTLVNVSAEEEVLAPGGLNDIFETRLVDREVVGVPGVNSLLVEVDNGDLNVRAVQNWSAIDLAKEPNIRNTVGSKVYGMRVCIKILSREGEGESGVEEKSNKTCKLTTSTRYLSRTRQKTGQQMAHKGKKGYQTNITAQVGPPGV